MKLSDEAIKAASVIKVRLKIALALGVNEATIRSYVKANEPNGELTKASVLQVIEEESGLTQEQILVPEEKTA